jgi:arylsulfatase A-like enzyme
MSPRIGRRRAGGSGDVGARRPHIVIVAADQWRGDVLGHMGNPAAQTPNLDAWVASEAVSLSNAFCQSPVCTPSRCSFMSGWYPHVRGHRTMHHMMRADEPVLLRTLKEHGYFVWWGGQNDLVPATAAFEDYCDVRYEPSLSDAGLQPMFAGDREAQWRGDPAGDRYYSFYVGRLDTQRGAPYQDNDWARVNAAIEQIRAWGEGLRTVPADELQPLCVYLSLTYPHPPYAVEEPWFSGIDRDLLPPRIRAPERQDGGVAKAGILRGIRERQGLQGWSEERWDALRATYYGMCARVDDQVGRILTALRASGLYDAAAVFFFSDHGDFTGDHGIVEKAQNTFEDCLVRVPFVVKPPAATATRPGVNDALVELIDFPATVEALAGIEPRHTHFGRSLLPLIAGEEGGHRDAVFAEGGRLRGERQAMELESRSSQVPTGLYWPRLSLQAESDVLHSKAAMCRTRDTKYVRRAYERDELYDLVEDPGEERNVIDDARYAEIRRTLADRLLTWYQETCDVVPLAADERE